MPLLIPYRFLLLLVILGGLAFGLDRWIVTDREAIETLVEQATEAARAGDFGALGEMLDDDYEGKGGSRDGALRLVKSLWATWKPVSLDTDLGEIQVDGDRADAPMTVTGQVLGRPLALKLGTTYVKREDGWKLAGAQVLGFAQPFRLGD